MMALGASALDPARPPARADRPATLPPELLSWRAAQRRLRVVVHDYAGHAFQLALSRELARRGYEVHHLYFRDDVTPRGAVDRLPDDPDNFVVTGIGLDEPFEKYNYLTRRRQERQYANRAADHIERLRPDILICTAPVDTMTVIRSRCARPGMKFVFWLQDIYSLGVRNLLRRKWRLAGDTIGKLYMRMERANLQAADHVVAITEDFLPILATCGVPAYRTTVIENWAPIEELQPDPAQSAAWLARHGLEGRRVVLYSGTLGLKHKPSLLVDMALRLRETPGHEDVTVLAITQGPGADHLEKAKAEHELANLLVLPWQPHAMLPHILAAATILVASIERDSGIFAVPSKVLSYLAVGRPILLAAPEENLAARTVVRAGAGSVVPPEDSGAMSDTLLAMLAEPRLRRHAHAGRSYARAAFPIEQVTDRFEGIWVD